MTRAEITNAPVVVGAPEPAHSEVAPRETTHPDDIRIPETVTNDPRWRAIWAKLLSPLPETPHQSKEAA
jgi:hypothetical protein